MARTLEELQKDLYDGFNLAMRNARSDYGDNNNPSHQAAAQALIAAGGIAVAIVAVEKQLKDEGRAPLKL